MTGRIEFNETTKQLVAKRAAYRCSFPDCDAVTVGPGPAPTDVSIVGEAAHIFSASPKGPRGRGALSDGQLRAPQNCIWLCRKHSRVVDLRRGEDYPPSVLLSYKALHEFRVARAVGGLSCPFGWLESITIISSPLFRTPATLPFAKSVVLAGTMGAGKTTLITYVATAAATDCAVRWHAGGRAPAEHRFSISCYTPARHRVDVRVAGGHIEYQVDGEAVPFNPFAFSIVELRQAPHLEENPIRIAGLSTDAVTRAVARTSVSFKGQRRAVRLERDRRLELDVDGRFVPVERLSGGEQKLLLLSSAMQLAEFSSSHRPTLLILDDCLHGLDADNRSRLLGELSQADRPYQTLVVDAGGARDVAWVGWQRVSLHRENCSAVLSMDERTSDSGGA